VHNFSHHADVPLLIDLLDLLDGKCHQMGYPLLRNEGGPGLPAVSEAVLVSQTHRGGGFGRSVGQGVENGAGI
jgi:hypothetical protein